MDIWNLYFKPFLYLLVEMAPYLLLGFFIAGVLHVFVPKAMYRRFLGASNLSSVLCAIVFGVPLPLCSCGVIPTAVGMRREGASKGATAAFLIATPQTGIDSILATYSVFGWPFALLRPVVAMVTGLVGGVATNVVERAADAAAADHAATPSAAAHNHHHHGRQGLWAKCREVLDYGFTDMLMDIGQWLVVGIVLAGLITIFVPEGFFLSYRGSGWLNMFVVLLIACPMYVCATGSIPIAAALMLKGLSPGAALVFLMAGPATNMASMMVLGKTLGRRSLVAYLTSIVTGAVLFGLAVDYLLPEAWFSGIMTHSLHGACCADEAVSWWKWASTAVFVVLLLRALLLRFTGHGCGCGEEHCGCSEEGCTCGEEHCSCSEESCTCGEEHCSCSEEGCTCGESCGSAAATVVLKVEGMMCNHCRAHVAEALERTEGVREADVDLASGLARVVGTVSEEALIAAVEACGYRAERVAG